MSAVVLYWNPSRQYDLMFHPHILRASLSRHLSFLVSIVFLLSVCLWRADHLDSACRLSSRHIITRNLSTAADESTGFTNRHAVKCILLNCKGAL